MRKIPCTLLLTWMLFQVTNPVFANSLKHFSSWSELDEEEIELRIQWMNCPVVPTYNADVASYLRRYLTYGSRDTEAMLGRGQMVFPIFEHYLELHGLPSELKYLPMIESSLVPYAVSHKGASGLWQFIASTGEHYGLIIDQYLDERNDPYKSTEAAVKYLKKLYKRFGTWELALAAYNCGPTRLSRVIRARGTKDFWKLRSSLPRETQRYLCKYIAACYIGTYYAMHGLVPVIPEEFQLQPMAARVYSQISLMQVANATGLDMDLLRKLNPSFLTDFMPARENGIFLVLPKESWYDYLDSQRYLPDRSVVRP